MQGISRTTNYRLTVVVGSAVKMADRASTVRSELNSS